MASLSLHAGIDEYLTWLADDLSRSAGTVREYSADLRRFVAFAQSDGATMAVGSVDRDLVHAYQRDLAAQTCTRGGVTKRLEARTRHRRLVALRSFLKFSARETWVPQELWMGIDLPQVPERLPKPLVDRDRRHLEEMLTATTPMEKRDKAFVLFLLSTGARISEAIALDRTRWNPDDVRVIGKGDKERQVHLTSRSRDAMADYLRARTDPAPALFISFQPARVRTRENRLSARGGREICERLARTLGLPHFSPHQLRHTLGTILQEEVGDARLTAEVLGHAGLGTVMGYTKVAARSVKEAYRAIEERGL